MPRSCWFVLAALCLAAIAEGARASGDELRVLLADSGPLLYDQLLREFDKQAAVRKQVVEAALASPAALVLRQQQLLRDLQRLVGPLPERTPLHARTLGVIDCEGYRIERVLFESRPRHHVTANLYLPDETSRPVPGVLVPCGHSNNGKASAAYQSACVLLALNGCAALIYDPIGQGERHQLPDPIGHGTNEHTLVGVGTLLVGWNTATFRIWDGLRSMDYLASRPEVDSKRLGCTGNSGGGTMTTWLMALDDRISVAAPSCFITTLERLFKTIGPQDCEQHFPGQGPAGIDHTDFITMRAPKPTLVLAAEQDFFDFDGTRTAAREAEAVYRLLGQPQRIGLFSHDDEHGFSRPRREAAVHWMRRWLCEDDRPVSEPELTLQTDAALQVTAAGQVVGEFAEERTVVDFSRERAEELREARAARWASQSTVERQGMLREAIRMSGRVNHDAHGVSVGTLQRDGYSIEKFRLEREGHPVLPALLCVPKANVPAEGHKRPLVIYVDSAGKAAGFAPGGEIERQLARGQLVLAVDLRGHGETADVKQGGRYLNDAFRTAMLAMHVGRPLLGQRIEDLIAAFNFARQHPLVDPNAVHVVAIGRTGPVAQHAAVLDPQIRSLTVRNSIRSWESDVVARPADPQLLELAVPGALEHYDLADLAEMLGERLTVESSAEPASEDSATSNK
jgi:cephalosporin-C deacetylase-like acetyl esterase